MKNSKLAKLLVMLLSLALLIGSAIGIAVSATGEDTIENTGAIEAKTIVHNDKIQLGFYIDATAEALTDGTFTVEYYWGEDGDVENAVVREDGIRAGSTLVATEGVAYYELTKVATVTVKKNGEAVDTAKYSVAQFLYAKLYADGFIDSENAEEAQAAAVYEALIDLGAKSQTYLNENVDVLASECRILYTDVEGLTFDGERYAFALPGENVTVTPVYTDETAITGYQLGATVVRKGRDLSVSGVLNVQLYTAKIPTILDFSSSVTDGVHLATGSAVIQDKITYGETYTPATKSGVWANIVKGVTKTYEGGRTEVSDVLKITVNDGSAKNTSLNTLGGMGNVYFAPTLNDDDGGNIHVLEFDFNWAQASKKGWRNPLTVFAYDASGNYLGNVVDANGSNNQYCVYAVNNGGAFSEGTTVENAYQMGISGTQSEAAGGKFSLLNSDTWYRIKYVWDQSNGKVNIAASNDGGTTWYSVCSEQTKKAMTDTAFVAFGFDQVYGVGGILYMDNIEYNIVSTMPEMPATNGK
jgi:hypothetical protein